MLASKKRTVQTVPYNDLTEQYLDKIQALDLNLTSYYSKIIIVDNNLTRQLVSFQANKKRSHFRWYKYKEAFSADLVEHLLIKYKTHKDNVLDPFAGAGTALFASSELGYQAEGVELLPVGQEIIKSGMIARNPKKRLALLKKLNYWLNNKPWNAQGDLKNFEILRITNGAYPEETETKIKRFLADVDEEPKDVKQILLFSLLCILEPISYTRKDGQYLRWDYRSGRRKGQNSFDKGKILPFDEAITQKLHEIISDITQPQTESDLFPDKISQIRGKIDLKQGSCLEILPTLKARNYSAIITSPPYCNRYDYTRTYALEHALLGTTEDNVISLRQAMLSCTVENKKKELLNISKDWINAINICDQQDLLQEILNYLDYKKERKELNNNGIARMVRGYFYEMACVIQECFRTLRKNGYMFMVNDNVRYAGASISVDLILSKIAEELGFTVENILVLPQGKGNSSQQMGKHGREALRKCVYVWKKEK